MGLLFHFRAKVGNWPHIRRVHGQLVSLVLTAQMWYHTAH